MNCINIYELIIEKKKFMPVSYLLCGFMNLINNVEEIQLALKKTSALGIYTGFVIK